MPAGRKPKDTEKGAQTPAQRQQSARDRKKGPSLTAGEKAYRAEEKAVDRRRKDAERKARTRAEAKERQQLEDTQLPSNLAMRQETKYHSGPVDTPLSLPNEGFEPSTQIPPLPPLPFPTTRWGRDNISEIPIPWLGDSQNPTPRSPLPSPAPSSVPKEDTSEESEYDSNPSPIPKSRLIRNPRVQEESPANLLASQIARLNLTRDYSIEQNFEEEVTPEQTYEEQEQTDPGSSALNPVPSGILFSEGTEIQPYLVPSDTTTSPSSSSDSVKDGPYIDTLEDGDQVSDWSNNSTLEPFSSAVSPGAFGNESIYRDTVTQPLTPSGTSQPIQRTTRSRRLQPTVGKDEDEVTEEGPTQQQRQLLRRVSLTDSINVEINPKAVRELVDDVRTNPELEDIVITHMLKAMQARCQCGKHVPAREP